MKCKVEWYTGDITIEIIIGENDKSYIFDNKINHSYYAPKEWCKIIE